MNAVFFFEPTSAAKDRKIISISIFMAQLREIFQHFYV